MLRRPAIFYCEGTDCSRVAIDKPRGGATGRYEAAFASGVTVSVNFRPAFFNSARIGV